MKYQTFRKLLFGVGSAAVLLAGFTVYKVVGEREDERKLAVMKEMRETQRQRREEALATQAALAKKEAAKKEVASPEAAAKPAAGALRPVDKQVLEHLGRGFAGDRLKDVFPQADYKVNVAKDKGGFRIKLDLNRDGHWDEKWTASGKADEAEVKRQVAPEDDERYSESYRLDDGAWRKK